MRNVDRLKRINYGKTNSNICKYIFELEAYRKLCKVQWPTTLVGIKLPKSHEEYKIQRNVSSVTV